VLTALAEPLLQSHQAVLTYTRWALGPSCFKEEKEQKKKRKKPTLSTN